MLCAEAFENAFEFGFGEGVGIRFGNERFFRRGNKLVDVLPSRSVAGNSLAFVLNPDDRDAFRSRLLDQCNDVGEDFFAAGRRFEYGFLHVDDDQRRFLVCHGCSFSCWFCIVCELIGCRQSA